MATRNIVGARTLNGIASPGTPLYNFSITPAPKNRMSAAAPPVHIDTVNEHLNTCAAFLYCFVINLAEISFETAIGSPYDDKTSIILYILYATL